MLINKFKEESKKENKYSNDSFNYFEDYIDSYNDILFDSFDGDSNEYIPYESAMER